PGVRPAADVIVVGGGPAGSMAALTLATRGVRTLLLDRKRFPRDKPCGGGIRYGVYKRFPELAGYLRATVAIHEIRRVLMEGPSGASVLAESDEPLYLTLRRTEFDAALLARARAAGAGIVEGVRVAELERSPEGVAVRSVDGRAFAARLVIGADGVNSVVTRQAGLGDGFSDTALAIDTMEETDLAELSVADPETMYVAYGYKGYPGYAYVFPKRGHVDAGVGFLLSFFKAKLDGTPYEHHARFLEEARARGVVRGRSNPANFKAYRLPLGGPIARTHADRALVCGDAGGFVNCYTGEGIYYAMVTGRLAGDTAAEAIAAGDCSAAALAPYETRWRREIGRELADSLRIQRRLFARPRLADSIIRAAAVDPKLCRLFARVALGEEDFGRRRLEIALRFLLARFRRAPAASREAG
ncbi:MAG: NAD(P)/FAD-dependent oxidoreductase, partial [Candidatus Rokuibacteriota bacterium]